MDGQPAGSDAFEVHVHREPARRVQLRTVSMSMKLAPLRGLYLSG